MDTSTEGVILNFAREAYADYDSAKSILWSIYYYPICLQTIADIMEEMREVCTTLSPSGAIEWIRRVKQEDSRFGI